MGARCCTYRLPEREENDQLDRQNLQEWLILADVILDLNVELDQAVHGDGDCNTFNEEYLSHVSRIQYKRHTAHTQICENAGLRDSSQ